MADSCFYAITCREGEGIKPVRPKSRILHIRLAQFEASNQMRSLKPKDIILCRPSKTYFLRTKELNAKAINSFVISRSAGN